MKRERKIDRLNKEEIEIGGDFMVREKTNQREIKGCSCFQFFVSFN